MTATAKDIISIPHPMLRDRSKRVGHIDPEIQIWDVAPWPPIFREAGGFFGSWDGKAGHTHGEGLAVNAALKSKVLKVTRV